MNRPIVLIFSFYLSLFSCKQNQYADTIIYGGTIYTVDSINSIVEAVAIKDGIIFKIGDFSDIKNFISYNTKEINLNGKTMIPGFIEGHAHIMGTGYNQKNLDLLSTSSYDEIIQIVKEKSLSTPEGEWIIGRGWHQDKWKNSPEKLLRGFPTHNKLSEAVPNHPVYLRHASGHASLANEKAMELFETHIYFLTLEISRKSKKCLRLSYKILGTS